MGIKIGDNNKFRNSVVSEKSIIENKRMNWVQKHPLIIGIVGSLIAGVVLMLSFWDNLIAFIQNLFGG